MEFTSSLGGSQRPSFFELYNVEQLREMIQPALKYGLAVYAQRYPRYFLRLVNRHEEFYALLMTAVEWHYLKVWNGTFAENFYGLRRVPVMVGPGGTDRGRALSLRSQNAGFARKTKEPAPLSAADVRWSMFFSIVVPYIKVKLDEAYDILGGNVEAEGLFGSSDEDPDEEVGVEMDRLGVPRGSFRHRYALFQSRLRRWFKKIYPYTNAAYLTWMLLYQILYLYGKTRYFNPWLHFMKLEVTRMTMADYRTAHDLESAARPTSAWRIINFFRSISYNLLEFLKYTLPLALLSLRFLEWWYQSQFSKRGSGVGKLPVPPPPEPVEPDPSLTPLPADPLTCPICLQPRTNPAVLPSGYTFCYPCAFKAVDADGRCPVTGWECTTEEIRKIFDAGTS
ncbi:Pex12 amino terminal region-domain-containing protein [Hyaloraphidium curvatum]|nr:Pex12 amino terminal region-domain-containing protein [Hyaloraphidium curvatum]